MIKIKYGDLSDMIEATVAFGAECYKVLRKLMR